MTDLKVVLACLVLCSLCGCKKRQAARKPGQPSSLRDIKLAAVPIQSGLRRVSAAQQKSATPLDVETERVVAWARRHCDVRWFDSFDRRGRRDGHARFECGLGRWKGQRVLTVKVDLWNRDPLLGNRGRRFISQRFDYEIRGAGRLIHQRDALEPGLRPMATLTRTTTGWVLVQRNRRSKIPAKETRQVLTTVRTSLRNGWMALGVLLTDGQARVGQCYRMYEFSALKGQDRVELRKLMGRRQVSIGDKLHPVVRFSGLFPDTGSKSETLTDGVGNDLLIKMGPSTWRLGPPREK